jgi:hypothetical protein
LEDALPEVAREEEGVGTTSTQCGKEQMGDADVLRLVDDREVEDDILALRDRNGQGTEQLGVSSQLPLTQPGTNALEDRPQHRSLRLRQPCLSAEARDIAVRLPALQLPRIHHLLPFGEQKMQAELVATHGFGGFLHQLAHDLAAGNCRLPDVRFVEP